MAVCGCAWLLRDTIETRPFVTKHVFDTGLISHGDETFSDGGKDFLEHNEGVQPTLDGCFEPLSLLNAFD